MNAYNVNRKLADVADPAELCVGIITTDELWFASDDALTNALIFGDTLLHYAPRVVS